MIELKPKARPKAPFVLTGLAVYFMTAYGAYLYFSTKNIPEPQAQKASGIDTQSDLSHVYDDIAKDYDSNIRWSEFWMGMPLFRRALARRLQVSTWPVLPEKVEAYNAFVKGNVLEVSAGTGRNVKYYPLNKCDSITLVDTSAGMLDRARKDFRGWFWAFTGWNMDEINHVTHRTIPEI